MTEAVIRNARETDDFYQIAACLYLTDPFIYPAAFGDKPHEAAQAISALMGIPNGLFWYKKILVAMCGKQVCGVLLYNKGGARWEQAQCNCAVKEFVPDMARFEYVAQAYFLEASGCPPKQHTEVVACCVAPRFRRNGVARELLGHLICEHGGNDIALDVLADNRAAVSLYSDFGFEIAETCKGFHVDPSNLPEVYRMIRKGIPAE